MSRILILKLGTIAGLMLLLMIPLSLIDDLVDWRMQLRDQVLEDIARSSSRQQHITGPVVIVPYRKTVRCWQTDAVTKVRYLEETIDSGRLYFLPERFVLDGQVRTELRQRGIYQARLYHSDSQISGQFRVPADYGIDKDLDDYQFDSPFIAVGISDVRGIGNDLKLRIDGTSLNFEPGSGDDQLGRGVHVPLPAADQRKERLFDFSFDLKLQGTEKLNITPVGRESQVTLSSNWPHPSFIGEFLPVQREVTNQGFKATWQASFFATDMQRLFNDCGDYDCMKMSNKTFGVSFIEPVDQYLKSDRAVKYALLFITLTFAVFFLFEVLKRLAVHSMQYAFVGMSLALFYLLLVSLSEHLGFALAYAVSTLACVALNTLYVGSVLRSWSRGAAFGVLLAILYGVLYAVLDSEDYALLLGSLLVFCALGSVMLLTRQIDWYAVGRPLASDTLVKP